MYESNAPTVSDDYASDYPHTSLTDAGLPASVSLLQPAIWYNGRSCNKFTGDELPMDYQIIISGSSTDYERTTSEIQVKAARGT